MKKKITFGQILTLMVLLVALVIPQLMSTYNLRILNLAGIYMIFGMSLNLLIGIGGTMSFGHAAFYGIGAYTGVLLHQHFGWSFLVTLPFVILVSALAGFLLALPMSRVTGKYVTIVTLGFCEIVNIILLNWESLTRGPNGIMNIPKATIFGHKIANMQENYYFVLVMAIIVYVIVQWTINSKLGRNLKAMRDDDIAAEAMGIKLFPHKVFVFSMSAALAGVAGSMYAHYIGYIDPNSFTSAESFVCLSIVVVGGLGNMRGTMIAALLLMALPEYLRGFSDYRMLVYGGVLVAIMWLNHSIPGKKVKRVVSEKYAQLTGRFKKNKVVAGGK